MTLLIVQATKSNPQGNPAGWWRIRVGGRVVAWMKGLDEVEWWIYAHGMEVRAGALA